MNEDKQQTTKKRKEKNEFFNVSIFMLRIFIFYFFWRNFGHNLFCFLKQLSLFHSFTHTHTRPHSETRHYLMLLILSKSDFHLKLVFVLICSNLFFHSELFVLLLSLFTLISHFTFFLTSFLMFFCCWGLFYICGPCEQ